MPKFSLESLRGGLDDTSAPAALADDACTLAENIEFFSSMLGERRSGCAAAELPASVDEDTDFDAATWMYRHLPDNTLTTAELWLLAQSLTASDNILVRRTKTVWSTVTQSDAIDSTVTQGHKLSATVQRDRRYPKVRVVYAATTPRGLRFRH